MNASGATAPYQYSIDGGNTWQTSNTFNTLTAGTYTIDIKDNNNCSDNVNITITEPTILVVSQATITNVSCFGGNDGSLSVNASGATAPYQYSIDGGNTWQNSNTFNTLTAGTYTIDIKDNNNCSDNINITITEPNQVNISTSFTEPSCHGGSNGSISLNVSGATAPYQYSIDGGNTWQTSNTFNALATGTYTIQIEDANGCNYSTSETITQPTQINITTSFNEPSCFGFSDGAISLNVSGATAPYQYSIDGGITWQTSNTFNALAAGTYTIQIEDNNGCSYSASETITQPTVLVVSQGNVTNVSCFGGNDGSLSVNASGATAPYQYSIDGGNTWQTSNTFNTLTAGTYTIDIKDNNNCSDNVNITITEPTILVVSQATITNVSCFGGNDGSLSVNVSGATAPYQYSIDGGNTWQNSNTFNTLTAGTYTIDIKDNNNCSDNINITITEPNQVNISTSFTEPSCHGGSNGSISLNVSGATAPYQYSIDGGNTWQTSNTFNALATGTYTIQIEDANGCNYSTSETITQPTQINITTSFNEPSCFGFSDGAISLNVSGATAPYQYSIDGGITWQTSNTFNALAAGTYTIQIEDNNGCSYSASETITQPTVLVVSQGNVTNVSCFGGNDGSLSVNASGATAPYQYSIDGGNTWQTSNTFNTLTAGTYTIDIKDNNNCSDNVNITITEPDTLIATFVLSDSICYNDSVNLNTEYITQINVSGNIINYLWEINELNSINPFSWSSPLLNPSFPTLNENISPVQYEVKITVDGGVCGIISYIDTITIKPTPQIDFATNPPQSLSCTTTTVAGNQIEIILNGYILSSLNGYNTQSVMISTPSANITSENLVPIWAPNLNQYVWPQVFRTYQNAGTDSVCVSAINECDTITKCCIVNVQSNNIVSTFTRTRAEGCEEVDTFTFIDNSYDPSILNRSEWCFNWDLINNLCVPGYFDGPYLQSIGTQYSWVYQDPGYYNVRLNTYNIVDSLYKDDFIYPTPMIVHPRPNTDFIPHSVCVGVTDTFYHTSTIDTLAGQSESIIQWIWEVSNNNGQTWINTNWTLPDLVYSFPNPGQWQIKLTCISNNLCSREKIHTINVNDKPTANFTTQYTPSCINTTVNFNGNLGIPGGSSTNPSGGQIIKWEWNFGDPINSTISNPNTYSSFGPNSNGDAVHIYSFPSSYYITLTVTDNNGCISIAEIDTLLIEPGITSSFTWDTVCLKLPTPFNASSSTSTTDLYIWEFYDPGAIGGSFKDTTTSFNTSYKFTTPGKHQVVLKTMKILTNDTCYSTAFSDSIYVWGLPIVSFSSDTACIGSLTNFTNNTNPIVINPISNINDANITQYDWIFYEPANCSPCSVTTTYPINPNTVYEFLNHGIYDVELIAYDDNNCKDTLRTTVNIVENPIAKIITNNECDGVDINLDGSTSTQNSLFNIIEWNFNINTLFGNYTSLNTPQLDNTTFLFDNPGNYIVNLNIKDQNNCVSSIDTMITIYQNPFANFNYSGILCLDTNINFCDISLSGDGTINSWNWNFGSNATPSSSSDSCEIINYTTSTNQFKQITLTVEDDNNCQSVKIDTIYINNPPLAQFSWNKVCAGQPVSFTNSSTWTDNIIVSNTWVFSDGSLPLSTNTNNLQHYYNNIDSLTGAYVNATLFVTDSIGCQNKFSAQSQIEIHPLPTINFSTLPWPCEGDDFIFNNNSFVDNSIFQNDALLPNNTFLPTWSFNSNLFSSTNMPWILSTSLNNLSAGNYQISLGQETNVTSEHDGLKCSSIKDTIVKILVRPSMTFEDTSFIPEPSCEGTIYNFDVTHQNVDLWQYSIDVSPPFNENVNEDFTYPFTFAGIYNLNIELKNNNGCVEEKDLKIHIYPNPKAQFNVNTKNICERSPVIFIDSSYIPNATNYNDTSFIEKWIWNFGDGKTKEYSNQITWDFTHKYDYNTTGILPPYTPSLEVITNYGCTSTYTLPVPITVYPTPTAILTVFPLSDPGLYLLDGSNSFIGDPPNEIPASADSFNYIFSTIERSLENQNEIIEYQFSSNSAHQNGLEYTIYLTVKDKNGILACESTDSIQGVYVDYFKGLYVPNTLAPNTTDGEASIFKPKGKSLEEYNLQIFDKFGNLIWMSDKLDESGKPLEGWDGNDLSGNPIPQGTYIWKINAVFSDGTIWEGMKYDNEDDKIKEGVIYLIR